jgi:hypothetical protein
MHPLRGLKPLPPSAEERDSYQQPRANAPIPPGNGDYYFNDYGSYLGRTQKGTGEESKGLIRIVGIPSYQKVGGYLYINASLCESSSRLITECSFDMIKDYTGTPARMLRNIALYFAKEMKIGSPILLHGQVKDKNGDGAIMFEQAKAINIVVDNSKICEHLRYYSFFKNALFHEFQHYTDELEGSKSLDKDSRHFYVYIAQINDASFMEMPTTLRLAMLNSVAYYVEKYWVNENRNGNYEPLIKMIDKINALYKRTGGVVILNVLGKLSAKIERKS